MNDIDKNNCHGILMNQHSGIVNMGNYEIKIHNILPKGIEQTIGYMKETGSCLGHLVSFWKKTIIYYIILKEDTINNSIDKTE